MPVRFAGAALALAALAAPAAAQEFARTEDVIYGRKHGLALTLDVFAPKDPEKVNGRGLIFCVSGGWFSAKEAINPAFARALVDRGYTVFAVVHGSQPKFTIPEVLDDMHRAVRFVRASAKKYNVDPEKLGIYGGSAGGHLSLMQGCAPKDGNPKAADPVERQPSRVAAVACFYPPTDFLNWGRDGFVMLGEGPLKAFRPPFDFTERDKDTNGLVVIADPERRKKLGRDISPVTHVSRASAPVFLMHGDADPLVPLQQAERFVAKLKEHEVPCELVVKKGAAHGWKGMDQDLKLFADWFDKHLK